MWTREHELEARLCDIRAAIDRGLATGQPLEHILDAVSAETNGALRWTEETA